MIIIGYPGIGKSTIASEDNRFVDLESSYFRNDYTNWHVNYVKLAAKLSRDGFYVFVSSHEPVVRAIKNSHIYRTEKIINVVPSLRIKDEWVGMLATRAETTKRHTDEREKNERAYERANEYYNSDIELLMLDGFESLVLNSLESRDRLVGEILKIKIPDDDWFLTHEKKEEDK